MIVGGILIIVASASLALSISHIHQLKGDVNGRFTAAIRPEAPQDD